MAPHRKSLPVEADRLLRRVTDAMDVYDQLHTKVIHAQDKSQRDRYEADLKKEIKKLQRLRDPLRSLEPNQGASKRKELEHARRKIERRMSEFTQLERVVKTKAFSNEALAARSQSQEESAQEKTSQWIRRALSRLREQMEQIEFDWEQLEAQKVHQASALAKRKSERNRHQWERAQYHQTRLEQLLRVITAGDLKPEEADDICTDVQSFVENFRDREFVEENEWLYEHLDVLPEWEDPVEEEEEEDEEEEEEAEEEEKLKKAKDKVAEEAKQDETGTANNTGSKKQKKTIQTTNRPNQATLPESPEKVALQPSSSFPSPKGLVKVPTRFPKSQLTLRTTAVEPNNESQPKATMADVIAKGLQHQAQQEEPVKSPQNTTRETFNFEDMTAATAKLDFKARPAPPAPPAVSKESIIIPPKPIDDSSLQRLKSIEPKPQTDPTHLPPSAIPQFLRLIYQSAQQLPPSSNQISKHVTFPTGQCPSYFPKEVHPTTQDPLNFHKLSLDTLLFLFYHQNEAHSGSLARTELCERGWFYQRQHQVWFKKGKDAKSIVYFDPGKWREVEAVD